ncbi:MAG: hypothetical protein WCO25_05600 [Candidatus Uhrbacteria bacterium]
MNRLLRDVCFLAGAAVIMGIALGSAFRPTTHVAFATRMNQKATQGKVLTLHEIFRLLVVATHEDCLYAIKKINLNDGRVGTWPKFSERFDDALVDWLAEYLAEFLNAYRLACFGSELITFEFGRDLLWRITAGNKLKGPADMSGERFHDNEV